MLPHMACIGVLICPVGIIDGTHDPWGRATGPGVLGNGSATVRSSGFCRDAISRNRAEGHPQSNGWAASLNQLGTRVKSSLLFQLRLWIPWWS